MGAIVAEEKTFDARQQNFKKNLFPLARTSAWAAGFRTIGLALSPQFTTANNPRLPHARRWIGLPPGQPSSAHAGHGWPPCLEWAWDVGAACSIRGPCLPALALSNWVRRLRAHARTCRKWIRELVTGGRRSARYGFLRGA